MSVGEVIVDAAARERIASGELDRTLFVEAGAGTGKTAALVERVVNLIVVEGVAITSIAAITFTEAAAAELRHRIRERLEDRLLEAERAGDTLVAQRCADALADADIAAISTLHSFAQRILSEHPIEVGIPPRVEVLDEVQSQLEFERRWDAFVDRLTDDPELAPLMLRAIVLDIRIDAHDKVASLRQVARIFNDNWDRFESTPHRDPSVGPVDASALAAPLTAVPAVLAECLDDTDRLARHIRDILPEVEHIARLATAGDDLALLRALGDKRRWRHGSYGAGGKWGCDVQHVRDVLAAADDACAAVRDAAVDETLRGCVALVAELTIEAANERREDGRLEFHDLLVLARRLLRSSGPARRALHDRYERLLLDEFQDTDPIQIELAVLITATVGGLDDDGEVTRTWDEIVTDDERLFFVGDPKQSIYRFRRADVELFLDARARFGADAVRLTQNFRTVPTVVAWTNHLFSQLMPEEVAQRQPKYEPLVAHRAPHPDTDDRVVLLGGPHDADEELRAADLRELEARSVAAAIDEIRTEPDHWPVLDRTTGVWRAPRLDEIVVLLPTRTSLPYLERALVEREIPHRADTGTLVYNTQEVRDLLAIARAVADPTDELAIVAALRSPAFACGDDDLLTWRNAGGRWSYRRPDPDDLPLDHPVAAAFAFLRAVHDDRHWARPSELLERIIHERRMFETAFAQRRPRDVWRRLRFVVDQARAFGESQSTGLAEYLAWAELQATDGARIHEPLLGEIDDESVRIMTIHGAKGLEFPITILSGLTTEHRRPRAGVKVVWSGADLPAVSIGKGRSTDDFDRRFDLEAEMDEHEKLRLLYVGLTRARDHLLVATHHRAGKPSFAAQIWDTAAPVVDELCRVHEEDEGDDGPGERAALEAASAAPAGEAPDVPAGVGVSSAAERDAWIAARDALLDSQRASRSISATGVVALAQRHDVEAGSGADGSGADGSGADTAHDMADAAPDDVADEIGTALAADRGLDLSTDAASGATAARPTYTYRRGRAGTAIGRAVHAVLERVDLESGAGVQDLARTQAHLESVPWAADEIGARVEAARRSDAVRRAVTSGRYWRETYVATPIGRRIIEGYVDLCFEDSDGLVVVDYKTDGVRDDTEADAALARYRLQGASYALAVEATTGRDVTECWFVFAGADRVIERRVSDLADAIDEVRTLLA